MIINMDCLEYLKKTDKVKCIFADIPDNLGLKYNKYDDNMKIQDYYHWVELLIMGAIPKCDIFWLSYSPKHDLEIKWIIRDILKYRHPSFTINNFIWRYTFSQYNDNDCAYGYRPIIRLMREGTKIYPDAIRELSKRQLMGDSRAVGDRVPDNVWSFPRIVGNSPERCAWHPTQHNKELMKRIIALSIQAPELIIDLCAGTGTTLRAAKELGLDAIGVEIDPYYCEMMVRNDT